jgi:hypothetical protein
VNNTYTFSPPRRTGLIVHLAIIIILAAGGFWGLWRATSASVGPIFLLYLLPALLAVPLIPYMIYRLYTLQFAYYTLERDQVHLRWGWRIETIPTNAVQWVRPVTDLEVPLKLPWFRWPGAMLGTRRLPDGRPVEFLASQRENLMLIGTQARVFAISPSDPDTFLVAYHRLIELGSLDPSPPQSVYPSFLFARVWESLPARYLVLAGALLSLGLLVWVSLVIPQKPQVSLGFTPTGEPYDPLPGIQLMLLPVLNFFAYLLNSSLGIFFYRRDENHPWAYLLWSASILVSSLFLVAVFFILKTG